jgi:hypothetical protein
MHISWFSFVSPLLYLWMGSCFWLLCLSCFRKPSNLAATGWTKNYHPHWPDGNFVTLSSPMYEGGKLLVLHQLPTASSAQDGDSKHGLHCSTTPAALCSVRLIIWHTWCRKFTLLCLNSAKGWCTCWNRAVCFQSIGARSFIDDGSWKLLPPWPKRSTGVLETKLDAVSSQVLSNSRFASILIRPAHVCMLLLLKIHSDVNLC